LTERLLFRGQILNTGRGAIIFIVYGTLWSIFGLWSLGHEGEPVTAIILALAALLLLIIAINLIRKVVRLPKDVLSAEVQARVKRIKRAFAIISIVQGLAIGAAFALGSISERPFYVPPAIVLIVGLHFFALAPLLRMRFDYIIGTLLCLLALVTVFALPVYATVGETASQRIFLWGAVIGIGSAIVLWLGAIARLLNVRTALILSEKAHS